MTDPATGVATGVATDPATLASAVRDAVLAVPGVARLLPGGPVEVATQFPGGKIPGIRLGDAVEVHIAVDPVPIEPLAEQIRVAVRDVLARAGMDRPVEVVIDDVDLAAQTAVPGR
jgi:hypothetical protein